MTLALIFPGQGAQEQGMGIGVIDDGAPGHGIAMEASEILGIDVVDLACRAETETIRATEVAQPLLLVLSVALLQSLPDRTREAVAAVAGHSLGEYTALAASGALPWQEALKLVRERGLAMADASSPGQGMSAVLALDGAVVEEVLAGLSGDGMVVVANHNAPGQVVISGELTAIEAAAESLKAAGARRVMPLSVAGAFHSPLMGAAAARLGAALDAAPLVDGRPQAFNLDGAIRTEAAEIRNALRAQLTSAVRWTDCVASLGDLGVDRFVELGPGSTLTAMGKRINPDATWISMSKPEALVGL
jgi:[acyl-carrier-protein] S-malonyltransferase